MKISRRDLLSGMGGAAGGLALSCCSGAAAALAVEAPAAKEAEVTAVEDLMREHGILRRALFVYSETAAKLRSSPASVAPDALQKTARLFRDFGEDYHEKKLEETYVFPAVKRVGGGASGYADILIAQHERGRQITDHVLSVTRQTSLGGGNAEQLAKALDAMVRMYRAHAAREDTVVFPAWKKTLTAEQIYEMSEKFEEIEHQLFGDDGFEDVLRQIAAIEEELRLADLAQFTAPPTTV